MVAFRQACAEDRLDVADHLLPALELLDDQPEPGSPVGEAYSRIVQVSKDRRRLKQST